VLAVGELLDLLQPVEILWEWTAFDEAPQGVVADFVSLFGKVLGPIVQFALTLSLEPWPRWAQDLESDAGYEWVRTFIQTGADGLRNARPQSVHDGARAW